MPHQLYLLRHAKASRDDPSIPDHERPLSKRGEKAAAAMHRMMLSYGVVPDLVLVSDARRTLDTLKSLRPWKKPPMIEATEALYLASAAQILEVLHKVSDSVRIILLIGHNPGLQELAVLLMGADAKAAGGKLTRRLAKDYPTGAFAEFTLTGPWSQIGEGSGQLTRFVTPRELHAAG